MIDYEHKILNEYRLDVNAEKIGLKIFKLSKHKKMHVYIWQKLMTKNYIGRLVNYKVIG